MTKEEIEKRVLELAEEDDWNHYFILPHGVETRKNSIESAGYCINKWMRLLPILENIGLEGMRVLDIGCSDGFFVAECAARGAKLAVGTEVDPLRLQRCEFIKEVYGLDNTEFKLESIYDLNEEEEYDIVLGLGLLHRVPDIDKCMEKIASVAKHALLEFKTLNDPRAICEDKGGQTKEKAGTRRVFSSDKFNKLHSIPTQRYVIEKMAEYGLTEYQIFDQEGQNLNYVRSVMLFSEED